MSGHSGSKAIIVALVSNFFVSAIKFAGWSVTQSPSLLAEAMHSLADTFNQSLLFWGNHESNKYAKKDVLKSGYIQFIFNFTSAIGIFILGSVVTLYHAFHDLLHREVYVDNFSYFRWGLVILLASFVLEGYSLIVAIKEINKKRGKKSFYRFLIKTDDTTLLGIFLEDSAAMVGIVLALVGTILSRVLKSNLPDIVTAISIATMMGFIAINLIINNSKFLIGQSLAKKEENDIREFLEGQDIIDQVVELKTEFIGNGKVHLYAKIEYNGNMLASNDDIRDDIENIKEALDQHESLAPILVDIRDQTVRKLGNKIKLLEKTIKEEYPEIISIDLENN
jgi:zinc transporter 9